MKQIIKQCIGIDISKDSFTACFASKDIDSEIASSSVMSFENNQSGFNKLLKWAQKYGDNTQRTLYLMEATGVYYEHLAYHLSKIKKDVSVCLPNKAKYFAKSYNIKTKNDMVDAKMLASFGVERKHTLWTPPKRVYSNLRGMVRLRSELMKYRTMTLNRKQALEHSAVTAMDIMKILASAMKSTEKQIETCEKYIHQSIAGDADLKANIDRLCTIKGVGFLTAVTVVAETQGFELIKSRKQLASYAGYDVVERQSGSSVKGQTRISKHGNNHLRAAMFFAAISAARHDPKMKDCYERVNSKRNSKMIGAVAVQRKLLLLMYTIWKNGQVFREVD